MSGPVKVHFKSSKSLKTTGPDEDNRTSQSQLLEFKSTSSVYLNSSGGSDPPGAVEVVDVVGINVVGVDVVEVDLVGVDVVVVDVVRVEAVDVVGTMYAGLPILFAGREVLLGIGGEVRVVLGKVGEEEV